MGVSAEKEGPPPTLSSKALLSKKTDKNGPNTAKIVQNPKKKSLKFFELFLGSQVQNGL
jgi:hypothetical protein